MTDVEGREQPAQARRSWLMVLRRGVLGVAVVLAVWTVVTQWDSVSTAVRDAGGWGMTVSVLAAAAAVSASGEQQRRLLQAWGSVVPATDWMRVFWLAQLGKYLPGSAWAYVAQMELARERGVRRALSVVVMAVGALLTVLTALVIGAIAVPQQDVVTVPDWVIVVAVAVAVAVLVALVVRPQLLVGLVNLVGRRVWRLGEVEAPAAATPLRIAVVWSLVAWLLYGLHLWVLVRGIGAERGSPGYLAALAGFALAWVIGFLFVVVPAGVGVREGVFVGVFGASIGSAAALAVALLSRFGIMFAELLLTLVSVSWSAWSRWRAVQAARPPTGSIGGRT